MHMTPTSILSTPAGSEVLTVRPGEWTSILRVPWFTPLSQENFATSSTTPTSCSTYPFREPVPVFPLTYWILANRGKTLLPTM